MKLRILYFEYAGVRYWEKSLDHAQRYEAASCTLAVDAILSADPKQRSHMKEYAIEARFWREVKGAWIGLMKAGVRLKHLCRQ